MTKRSAAKLAAGALLVAGAFGGVAAPASASDTGWNGTRVSTNSDTGWNGTKVVKKNTKIKKAAKKDSDTGWNGTRLGTDSDTGWNGT
jgi:hypothetical protein